MLQTGSKQDITHGMWKSNLSKTKGQWTYKKIPSKLLDWMAVCLTSDALADSWQLVWLPDILTEL